MLSDEQWLQDWRKRNNKGLRNVDPYMDSEERKQAHNWDLLRLRLRERYGDLALSKVKLISKERKEG